MLALCLRTSKERRSRSTSRRSSDSDSSDSTPEWFNTIQASKDSVSESETGNNHIKKYVSEQLDSVSEPIARGESEEAVNSTNAIYQPGTTDAKCTPVVEEEIVQVTSSTSHQYTTAPPAHSSSVTVSEDTEYWDVGGFEAQLKPDVSHEYVVKTYTCQPVSKMDVREALVGTNKKFECQVIGFPPPNIRWFKDNVEITHDPRYHFSHNHEDGVVSMHIETIKLSDAGLYQCRAENCEGYAITAAHLQVKAHKAHLVRSDSHLESVQMNAIKEVGVHKTDDSNASMSSRRRPLVMTASTEEVEDEKVKLSSPTFIERPETLTCKEEETIKVACRCSGNPKPMVTWFRDGKMLKQGRGVRIYDKDDEYVLEIPRCSILESGEYTCTATNNQGAVYTSFNVHVEGKRLSVHDLSAVEEENTTDVQSDKEAHFLSAMFVIREYTDSSKKITFKFGEQVEVLDSQLDTKWLVRKKSDNMQVTYIPKSYLTEQNPDRKSDNDLLTPTDSLKSGSKNKKLRKSSSLQKRSQEECSSEEEMEQDGKQEQTFPVYVAVADYDKDDLKISEGQFLEALDQTNPQVWLVRTKPTKMTASKVGWMHASYLEVKDGAGHVDRRSTREVFREDIIQITDKPAEAKVKRRYALGELIEAERDYINDLTELLDKLSKEGAKDFKNKEHVYAQLQELSEFHRSQFLPELMECMEDPSQAADVFLKWVHSAPDISKISKQQYFSKPMNQLKRYESLLKDFIRYTTRAGEDCSHLEKTLNMLLVVIKAIEDQQILNNIISSPDDVKSLGNVLKHDTVSVWDGEPSEGKDKARHLFLFPENLLMTKPNKSGSTQPDEFEFKDNLQLQRVKIYRLPSSAEDGDRRLEIYYTPNPDKVELYTVQCKNEYSRDAWIRDIADAFIKLDIGNYMASDFQRDNMNKKRKAAEQQAPSSKDKNQSEQEKTKPQTAGDATVTETDTYLTAAETDTGSTYLTAPESEPDAKKTQSQNKKDQPQHKKDDTVDKKDEPAAKKDVPEAKKEAPEAKKDALEVVKDTQESKEDVFEAKKDAPDDKEAKEEPKTPEPEIQPPGFKLALESSLVVLKGGEMTLKIITEGEPNPTVKWFKENKEIRKWRAKFQDKGAEHSVTISDIGWDNSGTYKAVISNANGTNETLTKVKVTTKKDEVTKTQQDAGDKNKNEVDGVKPKVVKPIQFKVSDDGHSARLDCKIAATPRPDVKWFHNFKVISDKGSKYQFQFDNDQSYTLIINDFSILDSGDYSVMAQNKLGKSESFIKIKSGDIPTKKTKKTEDKKGENKDSVEEPEKVTDAVQAIQSEKIENSVDMKSDISSEMKDDTTLKHKEPNRKEQTVETASVEKEQTTTETPKPEEKKIPSTEEITPKSTAQEKTTSKPVQEKTAMDSVVQEPTAGEDELRIVEEIEVKSSETRAPLHRLVSAGSMDEGDRSKVSNDMEVSDKQGMKTPVENGSVQMKDKKQEKDSTDVGKESYEKDSKKQIEPQTTKDVTPIETSPKSTPSRTDQSKSENPSTCVEEQLDTKQAKKSASGESPQTKESMNAEDTESSSQETTTTTDFHERTTTKTEVKETSELTDNKAGALPSITSVAPCVTSEETTVYVDSEVCDMAPTNIGMEVVEEEIVPSSPNSSTQSGRMQKTIPKKSLMENVDIKIEDIVYTKQPETSAGLQEVVEAETTKTIQSEPSVKEVNQLDTETRGKYVSDRAETVNGPQIKDELLKTSIKEETTPNKYQKDVRSRTKETPPPGPSPLLSKPSIKQDSGEGHFTLSWRNVDDDSEYTYTVEQCEHGGDWRIIKENIRDYSVELPVPPSSSRYRVLVVNQYGCSTPSLSVTVRGSRLTSSSLLEKLEKKYGLDVTADAPVKLIEPSKKKKLSLSADDSVLTKKKSSRRDRESSVPVLAPLASVYRGYTCTETDQFYWMEETGTMSTAKLLKAYADNLPLEPRFDVKDKSVQFAVEGRTAKIMVHVYTHPHSDIKWYFNGEKVMLDDRYSAAIYPSGLCVLEFDHMSWSDAGEYVIKVQNPFGFATKSFQVRVSDPPTFLETPKDLYTLNRLDEFRVSCRVDGIPAPRVMFYRDWSRISTASRCKVREDGDAHVLSIYGVLTRDSGTYQIVAENEAGRVHHTFNLLVEEGSKSDEFISVKKYSLEDHYYLVDEICREDSCCVYKVIEKSSGTPLHARIFSNPDPVVKQRAWKQMLAMQSSGNENTVRLVNVIDNGQQFVLLHEICTETWIDYLFTKISWTESYICHFIKELLCTIQYLHNAYVTLANLHLDNIYYDSDANKLKIDVYKAGWYLNTASHRSKYSGDYSMYCAPEVKGREVTLVSDMWNVGAITFLLLGGKPEIYSDGSINIDVQTLSVGPEAKDFITKLLQRECSERRGVEEALKHSWLKRATTDMRGGLLDVGKLKIFLNKMSHQPKFDPHESHKQEMEVIQEKTSSASEEAWLVDWFSKYKHDHDTYLIPIRDLDLPLRLREYRRSKQTMSVLEDTDYGWYTKTLRTRELGETENEEFKVRLTRDDLIRLAHQGLAIIEKQAAEASGFTQTIKSPIIFRRKLDTASFKVSQTVTLECEIEGDDYDMKAYWFRNDELIMSDIEKNTVLVSDRFTFSYAKDGKVTLVIKSAVPSDAGVYKCQVRCAKTGVATTRARLLQGDVPAAPGRPVVSDIWDSHAYLIWCEPTHDGNAPVRRYRVDYKAQDSACWIVCQFTETTSAVIDGLMACTTYRFRVSACNDFGYSSYSVASPEARTLHEGVEEVIFTEDMKRSIDLSLTPPAPLGTAGATLTQGISSPVCSRRNSVCDNIEEVTITTDRPTGLYKLSQKVVLRFSTGCLYLCERRDTKHHYLAAQRPHSDETVQELSLLKSLHHNHIQRLLQVYEGPAYYTVIYHNVSSENILQLLSNKYTYTERFVADCMVQLCDAVEYLHYKDIVHGSVHPYNVMMSSRNGRHIVLMDMSNARVIGDDNSKLINTIFTEFAAPEVLLEEGVSKSTDMWGIGLTALILLSGRSPFYRGDESGTKSNIQYLRFHLSSVHPNSTQIAHKFIYQCLKRMDRNRMDISEAISHPWLDVGHTQKLDTINFPSVEFHDLVTRLDSILNHSIKTPETISW